MSDLPAPYRYDGPLSRCYGIRFRPTVSSAEAASDGAEHGSTFSVGEIGRSVNPIRAATGGALRTHCFIERVENDCNQEATGQVCQSAQQQKDGERLTPLHESGTITRTQRAAVPRKKAAEEVEEFTAEDVDGRPGRCRRWVRRASAFMTKEENAKNTRRSSRSQVQ